MLGRFVNPDNSAFQVALNSEIYVDKTGLIEYTNKVIATEQALICNSRPRRFGKSITANMLVAYYSRGCDSEKMFANLNIAKNASYRQHLNKYDVIYIDVQGCLMDVGVAEKTVRYIHDNIISELKEAYSEIALTDINNAHEALIRINLATGKRFVVIIDEWDVLIRDKAKNKAVQEEYINFLRGMFKGGDQTKFLALAFMTGILPIKKYNTQSALNNFDEFTMLNPTVMAPYIGFTEEDVKLLCNRYNKDFTEVKRWYDGYELSNYHVYNPRAVVSLMLLGEFQSYWSQTGTYESIAPLINMNFDGLKTDIIKMLSGEAIPVRVLTYQNDMVTFKNKNDVLTSLVHLGYLAYEQKWKRVYIPNEEIRSEFLSAVEETSWNEFIDFQHMSQEVLEATLDMDAEGVAERLEQVHMEFASVIKYNDENSLSSVLSIAYLSAMQYYFKPIRELPLGRGFADFVFIPKEQYAEYYPALLVELKWNKNAETALQQIKEKKYPASLQNYAEDILLVGINYDKKSKQHKCVIEKLQHR